jgi:acyl carrier protein
MNTDADALRRTLFRLVVEAGEDVFTEQDLTPDTSLRSLGYSSLSYMRLIDAIENEFGVWIDPSLEAEGLDTVAGLATVVRASRGDGGV